MTKLTSIDQIDSIIVNEIKRLVKEQKEFLKTETSIKKMWSYSEILTHLLEVYRKLMKEYTLNQKQSIYQEKDINRYLKKLIPALKKIFKYYSEGKLIEAGKIIDLLFKSRANKISAQAYFPTYTIKKGSIWFRARLVPEDNKRLNKEDLFHVPSNLRYKVKTNRYAIGGFPCLYLAKTLTCANNEIGKPAVSIVNCCKNVKEFKVYDFTFFSSSTTSLVNQIKSYPIKIASSIPVINKEEKNYVEEYVMSQIILHSTILQRDSFNTVYGILYSSTNLFEDEINQKQFTFHQNLVVPPKYIVTPQMYSPFLTSLFHSTEPEVFPFAYINKSEIEKFEKRMKGKQFSSIETSRKTYKTK